MGEDKFPMKSTCASYARVSVYCRVVFSALSVSKVSLMDDSIERPRSEDMKMLSDGCGLVRKLI